MPVDILLPILGESISEAVLLRWLKQVGEPVKRGEPIAELETAKANLELESPATGVLYQTFVEEGTTVSTGQQLAVVVRPGEEVIPSAVSQEASSPPRQVEAVAEPHPLHEGPEDPTEEQAGQRISPAARKMAQDLAIDIRLITPSRPGARISTEDVQRYVDARPSLQVGVASVPSHFVKLNDVRKTTAMRMTESAQNIPQFSVATEIEMDRFNRALQDIRSNLSKESVKISVTALLIYLIGQVLPKHPLLNARFDTQRQEIEVFDTIHMAVAVSMARGLVAPVIFHVENLAMTQIARRLTGIVERANHEGLSLGDLSGATITLSNLGMYGVTQFIPLINPPQAAILGVGSIRPVLLPSAENEVRRALLLNMSLSADHRVWMARKQPVSWLPLKETIEHCEPTQIKI